MSRAEHAMSQVYNITHSLNFNRHPSLLWGWGQIQGSEHQRSVLAMHSLKGNQKVTMTSFLGSRRAVLAVFTVRRAHAQKGPGGRGHSASALSFSMREKAG